ncbi:MAG: hypothetical protein AAGH70_02695 [Pseudomonadota bacterium]
MSYGVRDEHDRAHVVKDYKAWGEIINPDNGKANKHAYYFPRVEFASQIVYFFLNFTFIKVLEKVAHFAVVVSILAWFAGFWSPATP